MLPSSATTKCIPSTYVVFEERNEAGTAAAICVLSASSAGCIALLGESSVVGEVCLRAEGSLFAAVAVVWVVRFA